LTGYLNERSYDTDIRTIQVRSEKIELEFLAFNGVILDVFDVERKSYN
jgi:hypothetical protein